MASHVTLGGEYEDERGRIQDLIEGPVDAVTRITTKAECVRGNHYHKRTTQWTYVLSGNLRMSNGKTEHMMGPGDMVCHSAGEPHAWKAVLDTDVLVFTHGPRAGREYEADTFRLDVPLLS